MKCFINHIFNLLEYLNFKERKRLLLFNEFHFFVFFFFPLGIWCYLNSVIVKDCIRAIQI